MDWIQQNINFGHVSVILVAILIVQMCNFLVWTSNRRFVQRNELSTIKVVTDPLYTRETLDAEKTVNYVRECCGENDAIVVANAFARFGPAAMYMWMKIQFYNTTSFEDLSDNELHDAIDTLSLFCEVGKNTLKVKGKVT